MKLDPATTRKLCEQAGVPVPRMTEAEFRRAVIRRAQALGWVVAAIRPVRVQRKNGQTYHETPMEADGGGWPDLFLVRGERAIAAELKVPPNTVTPEQRAWLDRLHTAGIETRVWTPALWPDIERELSIGG